MATAAEQQASRRNWCVTHGEKHQFRGGYQRRPGQRAEPRTGGSSAAVTAAATADPPPAGVSRQPQRSPHRPRADAGSDGTSRRLPATAEPALCRPAATAEFSITPADARARVLTARGCDEADGEIMGAGNGAVQRPSAGVIAALRRDGGANRSFAARSLRAAAAGHCAVDA